MLDLQMLNAMPAGTVFATGYGTDGDLEIRWLAKRGGRNDWCIYYHHTDKSLDYIENVGDKFFSENKIKEFVPCDDEAFAMYRH